MKPRPKWVPEFPHCRIKWIEKTLREIHCFFFKKYYGICIPAFIFSDSDKKSKPIYIWNAGPYVDPFAGTKSFSESVGGWNFEFIENTRRIK